MTGDSAQPACCVLALALFIDATGLEFREPSAEFGQLGRRKPQDRFLNIFDCHGRRNSTPASELEEPVAGKPGCTICSLAHLGFRLSQIEMTGPDPSRAACPRGRFSRHSEIGGGLPLSVQETVAQRRLAAGCHPVQRDQSQKPFGSYERSSAYARSSSLVGL
jgi:hypothetical protein